MISYNLTLNPFLLCNHISNATELVELSNIVNEGSFDSETTVFLESDIDFTTELSNSFRTIGDSLDNYFDGTFDGQGHKISNLKTDTSMQYAGLFGYSSGLTIKNVVLDSSSYI